MTDVDTDKRSKAGTVIADLLEGKLDKTTACVQMANLQIGDAMTQYFNTINKRHIHRV
ncbi:hypothetical protein H9P43_008566 [Blastocladiella emersonii ATCC 22665]|nr:hypothetical protein H9P43_008566 [Blastocladiella emersonii ATCC 22665]